MDYKKAGVTLKQVISQVKHVKATLDQKYLVVLVVL